MLIILEGPDGAGKTTLASEIEAEVKRRYPSDTVRRLRCGPPKGHPLDEYVRPLLNYRPGAGEHIIADRWHLGEWIYPAILGRESPHADDANLRYISLFLASRCALTVHVTATPDVLRRRIASRGDDLVTPAMIGDLHQAYERLLDETANSGPYTLIDTTSERGALSPYATDAEAVVECARLVSDVPILRPYHAARLTTYVGSPHPETLLIGDVRHRLNVACERSLSSNRRNLVPAFTPYPATSGHFLLTHLPRGFTNRVGLINACDVDDLAVAHEVLDSPRVVALGGNAYEAACRALPRRVELGAVHHPQYVRRFAHRHGPTYGRLIEAAALTGLDLRSVNFAKLATPSSTEDE